MQSEARRASLERAGEKCDLTSEGYLLRSLPPSTFTTTAYALVKGSCEDIGNKAFYHVPFQFLLLKTIGTRRRPNTLAGVTHFLKDGSQYTTVSNPCLSYMKRNFNTIKCSLERLTYATPLCPVLENGVSISRYCPPFNARTIPVNSCKADHIKCHSMILRLPRSSVILST